MLNVIDGIFEKLSDICEKLNAKKSSMISAYAESVTWAKGMMYGTTIKDRTFGLTIERHHWSAPDNGMSSISGEAMSIQETIVSYFKKCFPVIVDTPFYGEESAQEEVNLNQ